MRRWCEPRGIRARAFEEVRFPAGDEPGSGAHRDVKVKAKKGKGIYMWAEIL